MGHDDFGIHAGAERIGYASSNCDVCDSRGRTELRVRDGSVGGAPSDHECPGCGGSGRWWFRDTRRLGSFAGPLTDGELSVLLLAGTAEPAPRAHVRDGATKVPR